ncbi:MAG: efflux RND transporter periplasmic adaptor subunit [Planctomycetota bacterium]|nr:efflux RND transporter periplasmic adaptor subunit [Planctomycetota bacterium]
MNSNQNPTEVPNTETPAATAPVTGRDWKQLRIVALRTLGFLGQPILFIGFLVTGIYLIGIAQNHGWFSTAEMATPEEETTASDVLYICPMVCVPPSPEPGRCPICGMKLKQQKVSGDLKDRYGLTFNQANIRIANIQTAVAESKSLSEKIHAIGSIAYDESSLATISAYVDGRIEKLFADQTGFVVDGSCELGVLYSPELYLSQVALFQAKQLLSDANETGNLRIDESNQRFYESSRQRLIELGLSEKQVDEIENRGKPESRIRIQSPIEGTVVEKLVEEGQYVKTGQPLAKVADLSNVWLLLELFPRDAAKIRFGQKVVTRIQSIPGRIFEGRVAFVDTAVDSKTQAVPVRIVIPNPNGDIRIGDYATAMITVDVMQALSSKPLPVYDEDLAGKWISPRHPQIRSNQPGKCSICDMELVPAEEFGFSPVPVVKPTFVTVPRSAVLMVGDQNVAYVETKKGRFEFRNLDVDRVINGDVVVHSGLEEGERVVINAAMLLDSSFNMANRPSLIDPKKIKPGKPAKEDPFDDPEVIKALEKFTATERERIRKQVLCPVGDQVLGSMGPPLKIEHEGQTIWVCCDGCISLFSETPAEYLQKLDTIRQANIGNTEAEQKIRSSLARMLAEDRLSAENQEVCPVSEKRLGSMGIPIKIRFKDQDLFVCCEGCRDQLLQEPDKHIEYLRAYKARKNKSANSPGRGQPPAEGKKPGTQTPGRQTDRTESSPEKKPQAAPNNGKPLP